MSEAAEINDTGLVTLRNMIPEETIKMMSGIVDMYSNEGAKFEVKDQAGYDYIVETLINLKGTAKEVAKIRADLTRPFEAEKKAIIARFKPFETFVSEIERKGKAAMAAWDDKLEEIRRRKQSQEEKKAREREAELRRQADAAADKGNMEKAQALDETANATIAKQVQVGPEKTESVGALKDYEITITDKKAFVEAACTNPVLMSMINIDLAKVKSLAKQMKDDFDFPGVTAKAKRNYSIRS